MRLRRRSVVVVTAASGILAAGALVVAGAGASNAPRAPRHAVAGKAGITFASAGCGKRLGASGQSSTGAISACIRVGALAPGPHSVVAQEYFDFAPLAGLRRKYKLLAKWNPKLAKRLASLFRTPREPTVTLTVSPAAGRPGTVVTVTGRLASPVRHRARFPELCWDGCVDGLQFSGGADAPRWTSATTFRARLTVPAAPWVEGDPARVVPLTAGRYPIGVVCVTNKRECGLAPAEGTADFELESSGPPAWCRTASSCAELKVTPARALPGDVVRVTGHLPLAVDVSDPFGFFELGIGRARPRAPEVSLRATGSTGSVLANLGHGALDVQPSPTFASLPSTVPIAQTTDGLSPIGADPSDPSTVAWCGFSSIGISRDGVRSSIATAGAVAALTRLGYTQVNPSCATVAPMGGSSHGTGQPVAAIAAAFTASWHGYEPPPSYAIAMVTLDAGRTWTPLPVPPGATAAAFGGFRDNGGELQAVFATGGFPPHRLSWGLVLNPTRPLVESTSDGGRTWQAGPLGCPSAGPCLTLGPYGPGNCMAIGDSQPLLRSIDGGRRWTQPPLIDPVDACGDAELATTSTNVALLVNSESQYLLVGSRDGGRTWADIRLPPIPTLPGSSPSGLPGSGTGDSSPDLPGPQALTILPDGALLISGQQTQWVLLASHSHAWCRVTSVPKKLQWEAPLSAISVVGDRLWWLTAQSSRNYTPVIQSVPASSVSC